MMEEESDDGACGCDDGMFRVGNAKKVLSD